MMLLADVLPTALQAVRDADIAEGATVAVFGLGPVGQVVSRLASREGASRVLGVELVQERLTMARAHGVETIDAGDTNDLPKAIVSLTDGRGADAVIDCVGMEAEGSLTDKLLQAVKVQPSRAIALRHAIDAVRRGGSVSIVGVYGGPIQAFPLDQLFDKQVQLRMGQANVRRWTDELLPYVLDGTDPLGLDELVTHQMPLDDAPEAYRKFQAKEDGMVKVAFRP
jgi:threonine dehydrogenase-like Zn-dependent dehydrogenase